MSDEMSDHMYAMVSKHSSGGGGKEDEGIKNGDCRKICLTRKEIMGCRFMRIIRFLHLNNASILNCN